MDKFYRYGWLFIIIAMAGDIIISMVLPLFCKNLPFVITAVKENFSSGEFFCIELRPQMM